MHVSIVHEGLAGSSGCRAMPDNSPGKFSSSHPEWQVVLEAEPREWQSNCCMEGRAPNQLHPFLKTRFEDVAMDLATLQVGSKRAICLTTNIVIQRFAMHYTCSRNAGITNDRHA